MLKISSTGKSYEVSVYKNVGRFDIKTMLRGCNQFLVSPEKFISCHCIMSDIFFKYGEIPVTQNILLSVKI